MKLKFPYPISTTDLDRATKISEKQKDQKLSEQQKLKALAILAVAFYCRCMDIPTNLDNSLNELAKNSAEPYLEIRDIGKVGCYPILPNQLQPISIVNSQVHEITMTYDELPDDVREEYLKRQSKEVFSKHSKQLLGHILVQLDLKTNQGAILGFTKSPNKNQIRLNDLSSLSEFIDVIWQPPDPVINFNAVLQWAIGLYKNDWEILIPNHLGWSPSENKKEYSKGYKRLQLGHINIVLKLTTIQEESDHTYTINFKAIPYEIPNIPSGLEMTIEYNGEILDKDQAEKPRDFLEITIDAFTHQDEFSVNLFYQGEKHTENFIID